MDANKRNQNVNKMREMGIGLAFGLMAVILVITIIWDKPLAVRMGLFFFGILYDQFVSWLHRVGREKGVTAFLVVGGTVATLVGAGLLLGWEWMWQVGELFVYSGLPMIAGSWKRYTDERKRDEEGARAIARRMGLGDDDAPAQD